jgi:DNA-binding transcriptional LysR family regulator
MAAVVGPRHPWAHRTSVAVSELGEYPCVLFRRWQSPAMYDAILHAAEQGGAELTVAEEVDDRWHTRMVIRSRPLVAFGSAASGARAAGEGVVALPLTGPAPRLRLHVAWRADDTSAPVTALLDSLAATGPFTAA